MSETTPLKRVDFAASTRGPRARMVDSVNDRQVEHLYLEDDFVVWVYKGSTHYVPLSNVTVLDVAE